MGFEVLYEKRAAAFAAEIAACVDVHEAARTATRTMDELAAFTAFGGMGICARAQSAEAEINATAILQAACFIKVLLVVRALSKSPKTV